MFGVGAMVWSDLKVLTFWQFLVSSGSISGMN